MPLREARLRSEWRELYPGLRIEWEAAALLADRVLADSLLRNSGTAIRGRVLPDAHFDFRGGGARGGERSGVRLSAQRLSPAWARELEHAPVPQPS